LFLRKSEGTSRVVGVSSYHPSLPTKVHGISYQNIVVSILKVIFLLCYNRNVINVFVLVEHCAVLGTVLINSAGNS
jgi:hypothetical protein